MQLLLRYFNVQVFSIQFLLNFWDQLIIFIMSQMSQFKNKIQALRLNQFQIPVRDEPSNVKHVCSAEVKIRGHCSNSPRNQFQPPIIICKKQKKEDNKKQLKPIKQVKIENKKPLKKVQPFVPIDIPSSPRLKLDTKFKSLYDKTQASTPSGKKQIQIHIEKEMKDNKDCLKKLFKKIHQLAEDLAQSEKQRIRLELELNNLKDVDGFNRNQEKDLIKIEGDNYKLKSDIDFLKQLLKQRNEEIAALKNKVPTQIIKQIVVEKPVEVRVEVPKYVSGPEKIIQIPKYVENKSHEREVQLLNKKIKDLQNQLLTEKKRNLENEKKPVKQVQVPMIVEKPVYLDKPIYIDRPVYIQRPIQKQRIIEVPREPREVTVEVPVEVPIEVPIYIEKPVADQEVYYKLRQLERDMELFVNQNEQLKQQNFQLRNAIQYLQSSIQVLRRHNSQKNNEIQVLLKNTQDYQPIQLREMIRKETRIFGRNQGSRNAPIYASFNPNY